MISWHSCNGSWLWILDSGVVMEVRKYVKTVETRICHSGFNTTNNLKNYKQHSSFGEGNSATVLQQLGYIQKMYIDEQDFPHLLTNKVPKIVASTSWTVLPVSNLSWIGTVRRVEDSVANSRLQCLFTSPTHSRISSATSEMIYVVHISGEHVERGYDIAIFETKVICLNARHITDTLNNCSPYSYPAQKCVYFTVTFCVCTHDIYILRIIRSH